MLSSIEDSAWLWHHRLGHTSIELLRKLSHNKHVHGLPELNFEMIISVMQMSKQIRYSSKPKNMVITSGPLQLLHIDLFGPSKTESFKGKGTYSLQLMLLWIYMGILSCK